MASGCNSHGSEHRQTPFKIICSFYSLLKKFFFFLLMGICLSSGRNEVREKTCGQRTQGSPVSRQWTRQDCSHRAHRSPVQFSPCRAGSAYSGQTGRVWTCCFLKGKSRDAGDHENELTYTWAHYWAGPAIPRKRGLSVCYPGYEERLLAAVNSHVAFPGAKGSLKTRLISHRSSLRSGGC